MTDRNKRGYSEDHKFEHVSLSPNLVLNKRTPKIHKHE